jgi:hypothetical protein
VIRWKTDLPGDLPDALRDLKVALRDVIVSGYQSLAELSAATSAHNDGKAISITRLSEAASGDDVPTWDTVLAIYRACGLDGRRLPPEFRRYGTWSDLHGAAWREAQQYKQAKRRGQRADAVDQVPAAPTPRELPSDVPGFTGRIGEIAELDDLLAEAGGQSSAVVISAVSGTAGVGKTALAVHWAHLVRDRFPDGHLYIDLRGYDLDQPMQPAEALSAFLRSLGIAGQDIPPEPAEMARRYRSLLDGRRMLVVLDNARESDQVRLLLPGTPTCFVVITSRDSLAGVVARHGAHRLDIDLLPLVDAITLLRRLIGERVDAEPEAAAALVGHCARLPLALRIAAEVATFRPQATLAELVAELTDEQRRLHLLNAGGDPRTAVRAVFSWSYGHLSEDMRRSFRLVGLKPGPDIETSGTAALLGADCYEARRLLRLLMRAHLVQEVSRGRFGMHDLLRVYAREMAVRDETEPDRTQALTRVFDHYLYTAATAMDLLYPHEQHRRPAFASP